jgi:lon-related putative ATP-dependent protease
MAENLTPEQLSNLCDPSELGFESTADVTPTPGTIGQERAMNAIEFGLSLKSKGFNIYILGESGTGKMTSIMQQVRALAKELPVPEDWCYVYNFKEPDVPQSITLPPGDAVKFQKDMQEMVKALQAEMPKVFEAKEYERSRSSIFEKFQENQKAMFGDLEDEAKDKGFSVRKNVSGLVVVPVVPSGEPLTEDEFEKLDTEHRERIEALGKALQEKLDDIVRAVRKLEKGLKDSVTELERNAALSPVKHYIDEIKEKFGSNKKILQYLDDVREDILANLEDFKPQDEQHQSPLPFMRPQKAEPTFTRYLVNVLVNNAEAEGAPCIYESNPTYYNLFGRIEHKFQYGVAVTDFSLVKGGALHRANGGYLVLDALDLLRNLFSYEALKRCLRQKEIKMEDMWEQYKMVTSSTLKPEAVPLDVKVILVGNPHIYYMLYNLDEEYREHFKVKADFESRMERNSNTMRRYAEFVAAKCKEEGIKDFHNTGVAKIIEYGSRLSDHQEKLSSKFSVVADLLREAHFWAGKNGSDLVKGEHVEEAIRERTFRNSSIEDRMREMMQEDTIIVETSGSRVGQVNGLAVLSTGDYSFGKPSRITATSYAGRRGLMNIERETKMSGKIHEKAILIISNYIGSRYGRIKPISISSSITFEQLYDMVEGDSATCAELYALISSISDVPLRQDIAVTGSMDQNGDVQPIGGVNEKIEGFFDLCKLRGLDGSNGVIIPRRNLKHLMLKSEVRDAVKDGKFFVHAIDRMEEGLELLTGMSAGEPDENWEFPEGTVNHLVMKRFEAIAKALRPENNSKQENGENSEKENDEETNAGEKPEK